ncbi:PREDICTED: uncharacterized protein LOC108612466 [Drosophila arizonae]|uniref:Uncharacterized protein LOC108612466 n=1 Tax=Drosophila arizonae TaxID=7263 RepID=A0ABM1P0V2_DROAR|nr:PREDICTED: uncharacterized protein LOC108612466 [Drosophila arizonae]
MGQNLSLRRPRISLTWVLREQHQPTQQQPGNEPDAPDAAPHGHKEKEPLKLSNGHVGAAEAAPGPAAAPVQRTEPVPTQLDVGKKRYRVKQLPGGAEPLNGYATTPTAHQAPGHSNGPLGSQKFFSNQNLLEYKDKSARSGAPFGYEIHNVDEFLSRCSLSAPGNIPVVLATASTLYQTRPGGYQLEIPLPLGMVVNAVFKNQNWLYVQTPHAEEGYVGYACCLPLGILPTGKTTPCWESNADIFPRPCGNMTDSEKEIRLRGGTRSDGARTPRQSKPVEEHNNNNNNNNNINPSKSLVSNGGSLAGSLYGEQHVDKLYLRAASQPKLVEKAYAQLRSTKQLGSGSASVRSASNDEYVTLQQQQQQRTTKQQRLPASQSVRRLSNVSYITNGHNGQHLHPKSIPQQHQQQQQQQQLSVLRRQQQNGLRQTLVAINADYITESIVVHKGEIVTLCECRESKDQRQWFYVKTRDGREGFIPAEVAGHGYL